MSAPISTVESAAPLHLRGQAAAGGGPAAQLLCERGAGGRPAGQRAAGVPGRRGAEPGGGPHPAGAIFRPQRRATCRACAPAWSTSSSWPNSRAALTWAAHIRLGKGEAQTGGHEKARSWPARWRR
ncbi:MAG: hypothetical protein MZV70_18110 [Desulfobacterales bacterium]|nr:hypothetical protein [Desulfobacterales bacterium]